MKIALIAFTQRGFDLARDLARGFAAEGDQADCSKGFGEGKTDHNTWAAHNFGCCDALVFVGATGIAVRTIAPLLVSKASDPAVIAIDERATFAIPLVSGHIGGANKLARRISAMCGATPVITTATDVSGVFAIDTWATEHGLMVANPGRIKNVSGALLRGQTITVGSEFPILGAPPKGVKVVELGESEPEPDVLVGIHLNASSLRLVPRCAILGIGCRKGTPYSKVEHAADEFLFGNHVDLSAVTTVASIDLKADEPGILEFAKANDLTFKTFSSQQLNEVSGEFKPSPFVSSVTGTDNVCERSVVAAGGNVVVKKTIVEGLTFALAVKPMSLTWQ